MRIVLQDFDVSSPDSFSSSEDEGDEDEAWQLTKDIKNLKRNLRNVPLSSILLPTILTMLVLHISHLATRGQKGWSCLPSN